MARCMASAVVSGAAAALMNEISRFNAPVTVDQSPANFAFSRSVTPYVAAGFGLRARF